MPGFNVETFKSEISKRNGFLTPSRFLMTFVPPAILSGRTPQRTVNGTIVGGERNPSIGRSLEYWCESVMIPGYQFMQGDTRRWTYGPLEKRPFAPNTVSLQTVFLSDGNGDMLKFFNMWMNNIIPHYVQGAFTGSVSGAAGMAPYEVRYKQEYATDLHIYVFRQNGDQVLHYVVKEAFPSHVLDTPMSWDAQNQNLKFSVIFDYLEWYLEEDTVNKQTILGNQIDTIGLGAIR